jgi:hypothetical protein
MRMCRVAGLAGMTAVLMVATATTAGAQTTTSSTTTSTTTSTSLEPTTTATSLEPTTTAATSADESASDLAACKQLFAGRAGPSDEITPVGPPVGRSLRLRIKLITGAFFGYAQLCVQVRGSSGDPTITTQTWGLSGWEEGVRTVLLPAEPLPGSQVCTQAVLYLFFNDPDGGDFGWEEVQQTGRNCVTISAVASGEGNEGELPFTGPGRGLPFEGAVGLVLLGTGAALVRRFGRRVPR